MAAANPARQPGVATGRAWVRTWVKPRVIGEWLVLTPGGWWLDVFSLGA